LSEELLLVCVVEAEEMGERCCLSAKLSETSSCLLLCWARLVVQPFFLDL